MDCLTIFTDYELPARISLHSFCRQWSIVMVLNGKGPEWPCLCLLSLEHLEHWASAKIVFQWPFYRKKKTLFFSHQLVKSFGLGHKAGYVSFHGIAFVFYVSDFRHHDFIGVEATTRYAPPLACVCFPRCFRVCVFDVDCTGTQGSWGIQGSRWRRLRQCFVICDIIMQEPSRQSEGFTEAPWNWQYWQWISTLQHDYLWHRSWCCHLFFSFFFLKLILKRGITINK